MSPLLFDLVADALSILMNSALENDLIKGVLGNGENKGVGAILLSYFATRVIFLY